MPYSQNRELPESVRDTLPEHARDIYREAFNNAFDQYNTPEERQGDATREETAHKVAWSAVKNSYEKNENDEWVAKE